MLIVAMAAACSSGASSSSGEDDPVGSAVAGATDPLTDATAGDVPDGRGLVTENADGTRTVTSSYGTALVPADPQRIVSVIGDIDFEAMLALGVEPVGAGTQGGTAESGFAPHLGDLVDGIEAIAWTDGVQPKRSQHSSPT